jgi:hypothetical protein
VATEKTTQCFDQRRATGCHATVSVPSAVTVRQACTPRVIWLASWATDVGPWAASTGHRLSLGLLSAPGRHGLEAALLGRFADHYCSPNFHFPEIFSGFVIP